MGNTWNHVINIKHHSSPFVEKRMWARNDTLLVGKGHMLTNEVLDIF